MVSCAPLKHVWNNKSPITRSQACSVDEFGSFIERVDFVNQALPFIERMNFINKRFLRPWEVISLIEHFPCFSYKSCRTLMWLTVWRWYCAFPILSLLTSDHRTSFIAHKISGKYVQYLYTVQLYVSVQFLHPIFLPNTKSSSQTQVHVAMETIRPPEDSYDDMLGSPLLQNSSSEKQKMEKDVEGLKVNII